MQIIKIQYVTVYFIKKINTFPNDGNVRFGANMEKQINASLNSIASINAIEESVGLDVLPLPLKTVALMRKEHQDATLSELASILNVSKSCLNHRLRKIAEIAKNL